MRKILGVSLLLALVACNTDGDTPTPAPGACVSPGCDKGVI